MKGLRKGTNTTQHPPSPASRAGADLPTNVQDVSRAVSNVNTHRPRFQVRARPFYICEARETECGCVRNTKLAEVVADGRLETDDSLVGRRAQVDHPKIKKEINRSHTHTHTRMRAC